MRIVRFTRGIIRSMPGVTAIGGFSGIALGFGILGLLTLLVPALPVSPSWSYMVAAVLVAVLIGLIAGVLPAWRAARLDPVESLRTE